VGTHEEVPGLNNDGHPLLPASLENIEIKLAKSSRLEIRFLEI